MLEDMFWLISLRTKYSKELHCLACRTLQRQGLNEVELARVE